jgi:hypothetical protein
MYDPFRVIRTQIREFLVWLGGCITILAITSLVLCAVWGAIYLKWSVYHQRFPSASWWTFLFN